MDQLKGCQGALSIGEGIARASNTKNRNIVHTVQDCLYIAGSLLGSKHLRGYARTTLIHTIEFTVAEIALDIATRGDRKMDSSLCVSCIRIEARMF